jgi:DNA-binding response OmpR family regulator
MTDLLANDAHDLSEPGAPDLVILDAKASELDGFKSVRKNKLPLITKTLKEPE